MKPLLYCVFVLCLVLGIENESYGQKNDYVWLFGYDNSVGSDSDGWGGRNVYFNSDTVKVIGDIRIADFNSCNVSYCDNNGNLLFYSNCGDVFDARDSVMLGGDSINYGQDWMEYQGTGYYRYSGLNIVQGILALPQPRDSNNIYLCHYSVNFVDLPDGYIGYPTDTSYYSLVNLNGDSGYGEVTKRNVVINSDTLNYSMLSAVRHGNGLDWWILHPFYEGNCYDEFLLSDTGIGLYSIQCLGQNLHEDLGTSCFSPNGENYFLVEATDGIRMFNFDRCTGLLSNPQIIPFPSPSFADSMTVISGVAVSPNNRYLYIAANIYVLQYDLLAPNIGASVDTVAIWDGFYDDNSFPTNFFIAQIGPDGKIYISSTSSTHYLHVINNPDAAGDSCLLVQRQLNLTTFNYESLPNFPNYRLGALSGSPCDTLTGLSEIARAAKEAILKVFPNPATDIVTIDYGFTDWSQTGAVSLEISNGLGQIVYQQALPQYSGYQKLDVSKFAAGLYTAFIRRNTQVIAVQKFAVVAK